MEHKKEIKYETNNDVTTLVGRIAPYETRSTLYNTLVSIEIDCLRVFGEGCVTIDWSENTGGNYANKSVHIDISKKPKCLKWYYRIRLYGILRKHGVNIR